MKGISWLSRVWIISPLELLEMICSGDTRLGGDWSLFVRLGCFRAIVLGLLMRPLCLFL